MNDTALIAVDTLKAVEVFAPGGVDKLIEQVETDARAQSKELDGATPKGRDGLKSLAYKVTRSKTALDDMGKEFVAKLKREAGKVDVERRKLRERLDELRDEIRKPADEFDAKEEARIETHLRNLASLAELEQFLDEPTIENIEMRLGAFGVMRAWEWEEFADRAQQLIARIPATLQARHAALIKQEADRAELEQLRKAEADRVAAERAATTERERKERDDKIAKDAIVTAEVERLAAIRRAELAESTAVQAKTDAIEAERRRVADIAAQEAAETARREANKSHRAKINREAVNDLMSIAGLKTDQAKAVVMAIVQDKIRNIEIVY